MRCSVSHAFSFLCLCQTFFHAVQDCYGHLPVPVRNTDFDIMFYTRMILFT